MHHVGIIPFRLEGRITSVLLVTSQTRGRWIFPKGRVENGETAIEAGRREGFEEAGVRGTVLENFPQTVVISRQGPKSLGRLPVTYYPMLVDDVAEDWPEKAERQRKWATVADALKLTCQQDFGGLLEQFQTLDPWIRNVALPLIKNKRSRTVVTESN